MSKQQILHVVQQTACKIFIKENEDKKRYFSNLQLLQHYCYKNNIPAFFFSIKLTEENLIANSINILFKLYLLKCRFPVSYSVANLGETKSSCSYICKCSPRRVRETTVVSHRQLLCMFDFLIY